MGKVLQKYSLGIFFQFTAFMTLVLNSHKSWSVAELSLVIGVNCINNFFAAYMTNGNLQTHVEWVTSHKLSRQTPEQHGDYV